jgi:hypothetical protein
VKTQDLNIAPVADADKLTISDKAKAKAAEKKSFEDALEEMRAERRELSRQMEQARKMGEGVAKQYADKLKCLQIAMRIMQGDKVPPADHRFLSEKEPELYFKAVSMRIEKEDPKEHDRLSEDEEDEAAASDGAETSTAKAGGGEPAAVQTDGGDAAPAPEAGTDPGVSIDIEA